MFIIGAIDKHTLLVVLFGQGVSMCSFSNTVLCVDVYAVWEICDLGIVIWVRIGHPDGLATCVMLFKNLPV